MATSIFDRVKKAFVEEVPSPPAPPAPVSTPDGRAAVALPPVTSLHSDTAQGFQAVKVDAVALHHLETAAQQAFSDIYSKFIDQYESLREVVPDEATRIKAAIKTSHASAPQVTEALDHVLQTLEGLKDTFQKSFDENSQKASDAAQAAVEATKDLMKSREAQMKAIEEELVSLKSKLAADEARGEEEKKRLDGVRLGFDAAFHEIHEKFSTQKQKVTALSV